MRSGSRGVTGTGTDIGLASWWNSVGVFKRGRSQHVLHPCPRPAPVHQVHQANQVDEHLDQQQGPNARAGGGSAKSLATTGGVDRERCPPNQYQHSSILAMRSTQYHRRSQPQALSSLIDVQGDGRQYSTEYDAIAT